MRITDQTHHAMPTRRRPDSCRVAGNSIICPIPVHIFSGQNSATLAKKLPSVCDSSWKFLGGSFQAFIPTYGVQDFNMIP